MRALTVAPESFSNSETLIGLLNLPGTKEVATQILEATSSALCRLLNESACKLGIGVESLFDTQLTLTMNFQMPRAEDLFNPDVHVEVSRA